MPFEKCRGNYTISTDVTRLDIDVIHPFLTESYWACGIPRGLVRRAIANSLCFGLYEEDRQIGFARAVTDYVRCANIMDVFVLEAYRGRGLGTWLMQCVMEHLTSFGLSKMTLNTRDAQEFYGKFGFREISRPQNCMEARFEPPWFRKE